MTKPFVAFYCLESSKKKDNPPREAPQPTEPAPKKRRKLLSLHLLSSLFRLAKADQ